MVQDYSDELRTGKLLWISLDAPATGSESLCTTKPTAILSRWLNRLYRVRTYGVGTWRVGDLVGDGSCR